MKFSWPKSDLPWKAVLSWAGYGLFVLAVLVVSIGFGWINQSPIAREVFLGRVFGASEPPEHVFSAGAMNLLILGVDENRNSDGTVLENSRVRSDMILLARLDFENNRITGVSIPRDTLATPEGYSTPLRINAFHAIGGAELAAKAVESLIGVRVDRTIVVSYSGFQRIVDMLGGVEVNVTKALNYHDDVGNLHIELAKGKQLLNGYEAMGYVRYRKDSDFQRQQRQKRFLTAFRQRVKERWTKIPALIDELQKLTGDAFTDEELAALFNFGHGLSNDSIRLGTIPVWEAENYDLVVDSASLEKTLKEFELLSS
ncbi:MAG: LCP family protein [Armatimonadetes bacterium]|nr:LCP family protein [Armatimonadota bacterium]